jgi:uncharacterized membrane protein
MGFRRSLLLMSLTVITTLFIETVGVLTGGVFGSYFYTDVLGPGFLGLVPYAIPMTWFVLVYPSYVIAEWLVPAGRPAWTRGLAVAVAAASVTTAIDVALDPVMVEAGAWVWQTRGICFGIPAQNYVGWWMTAFVVVVLHLWAGGARSARPAAGSACLARLAILSYATIAFGAVSTAFHMRLTGPALLALEATTAAVVASLRSTSGPQSRELGAKRYKRVEPIWVDAIGGRDQPVCRSARIGFLARNASGSNQFSNQLMAAIPPLLAVPLLGGRSGPTTAFDSWFRSEGGRMKPNANPPFW